MITHPVRRAARALPPMTAALALTGVAAAGGADGGEEPELLLPEDAGDDPAEEGEEEAEDAEAAPVELPEEVENDGWRGQLIGPDPDPNIDSPYQIATFHDEQADLVVVFDGVETSGEGVDIRLSLTWPPFGDQEPLQHNQFFVESAGERHTTGDEGELLAPPGGDDLDIINEVTVSFPGAPDGGAVFFQGPDHDADGSGLPPIGVCYQVGDGFNEESCTG
jgi:hypothetical protein